LTIGDLQIEFTKNCRHKRVLVVPDGVAVLISNEPFYFVIQVLPVMIMGAFIPGLRRKYPFHEYVSAVMLVIGLILFTLADAQTSPNFSMIGVTMVSAALVMDAFLGNLQEAIFKMNPDTTQVPYVYFDLLLFHEN
jgi:hypothetical protein